MKPADECKPQSGLAATPREPERDSRRAYVPPQLTRLGSVEELTLGCLCGPEADDGEVSF